MSNTKKIKTNTNNTRKSNKSELNLNVINQANENLFTSKEIEIIVGDKPYSVKIDQNFRTTKIEKMVKNLVNSKNIEEFKKYEESIQLSYYFYLIIKTFTDLDIPDGLEFEQEISLINSLIDLGIFEIVIENIPEGEIKKVNEFMAKFNVNLKNAISEMNVSDGEVIENVENFAFGNVIHDESGDLIE